MGNISARNQQQHSDLNTSTGEAVLSAGTTKHTSIETCNAVINYSSHIAPPCCKHWPPVSWPRRHCKGPCQEWVASCETWRERMGQGISHVNHMEDLAEDLADALARSGELEKATAEANA